MKMMTKDEIKEILGKYIHHYQCEDSWYACPKSEEGAGREGETECNCGLDNRINKIAEALAGHIPYPRQMTEGEIRCRVWSQLPPATLQWKTEDVEALLHRIAKSLVGHIPCPPDKEKECPYCKGSGVNPNCIGMAGSVESKEK